MYGDMKMQKKIRKTNPLKKNMDKFHKPRTHKDKTKYDRKSDWPTTEYDESDDIENTKRIIPPQPEKVFQPFNGGKGG